MNSKNSQISESHRLLLKLAYKISLRCSDKYVSSSNLRMYYIWKNLKM